MISLVVPTYKERENIRHVVERASAALAATGEDFEIIVVDDNSPDGTAEEVWRFAESRSWLRLVVREHERDLATAVMAGWHASKGDVLGCIDADLQHPPEVLKDMVQRMRSTHADIVVASRRVAGAAMKFSLSRRCVSWAATLLAAVVLPGALRTVHDPMSGFFLVRRKVLANATLSPIGYKILLEVLANGDYERVEEVPFTFEERIHGGSKAGLGVFGKYVAHLYRIALQTGEAKRMLKFGLVGLSGVPVNYLALRGFQNWLHWPVLWAASAGVALAIVSNFIWNDLFTFWETRKVDPGLKATVRRFVLFTLFSLGGAVLNIAAISVLVRIRVPLLAAVAIGIVVAGVFNFVANANFSWRAFWSHKLLAHVDAELRTAIPDKQPDVCVPE
jgi:dolichol-phosphate mannosyltransferase